MSASVSPCESRRSISSADPVRHLRRIGAVDERERPLLHGRFDRLLVRLLSRVERRERPDARRAALAARQLERRREQVRERGAIGPEALAGIVERPQPCALGELADEVPGLEGEVLPLVHDDGVPAPLAKIRRALVRRLPVLVRGQVALSVRTVRRVRDGLREPAHGLDLDAAAGEARLEPLAQRLREAQE